MEHLSVTGVSLAQGKRCIELRDQIQASEKLYRSAEEAIKALAEKHGIETYVEAEQKWGFLSYLKTLLRS